MSLSKVSVENSLKPEKFVKISWVDKLLPNYFSILKYLSITDFSVVKAQSYESLVPVKLLRGVDLTKHLYVTLLGVVVSGVWNVPESCRGGTTVALVDTRMHSVAEGTICKFSAPATVREFSVRFIPNYSVVAADALRDPWSLFVRLSNVGIKDGFHPLTLEVACLVATTNSIIKKGLRASVVESVVSSDQSIVLDSLSEKVEPFFDKVSISAAVMARDPSYRSRSQSVGGRGKRHSKPPNRRLDSASEESSSVSFEDGLQSDHT